MNTMQKSVMAFFVLMLTLLAPVVAQAKVWNAQVARCDQAVLHYIPNHLSVASAKSLRSVPVTFHTGLQGVNDPKEITVVPGSDPWRACRTALETIETDRVLAVQAHIARALATTTATPAVAPHYQVDTRPLSVIILLVLALIVYTRPWQQKRSKRMPMTRNSALCSDRSPGMKASEAKFADNATAALSSEDRAFWRGRWKHRIPS